MLSTRCCKGATNRRSSSSIDMASIWLLSVNSNQTKLDGLQLPCLGSGRGSVKAIEGRIRMTYIESWNVYSIGNEHYFFSVHRSSLTCSPQ